MADRLPFLSAPDINRVGVTKIKLAGPMRIYSGQKGVSLIMEVIIGSSTGPRRDWSLMLGKRSFDILQGILGRDLSKWPGGTVNVEVDPTGKFVNPVDPKDSAQSAPATAPASAGATSGAKADDDIPF